MCTCQRPRRRWIVYEQLALLRLEGHLDHVIRTFKLQLRKRNAYQDQGNKHRLTGCLYVLLGWVQPSIGQDVVSCSHLFGMTRLGSGLSLLCLLEGDSKATQHMLTWTGTTAIAHTTTTTTTTTTMSWYYALASFVRLPQTSVDGRRSSPHRT